MKQVVLYARAGCCLCDDAREMLERIRARNPDAFAISERDIESDDALLHRYLERIPVIAIDGVDTLELQFDEGELAMRLGIVGAG